MASHRRTRAGKALVSCIALLLAGCVAAPRTERAVPEGARPDGIGPHHAAPSIAVSGPSPVALSDVPRRPASAKFSAEPGSVKKRKRPRSPGLTPSEADALRATAARQAVDAAILPIAGRGSPALAAEDLRVIVNADALDVTECCGNPATATVPPDPEVAAGPQHLVGVVNTAFEVFDKQGASLAPAAEFDAFFSGLAGCVNTFDPNVHYDEAADRFMVGIAGQNVYCFAVSQTGDPTGTWIRYSFPTASSSEFFDFPHAGIGRQAIFMGANIFNSAGTAFIGGRVWAIDKAAAYAGSPLPPPVVRPVGTGPAAESTPQPVDVKGAALASLGTHYFVTDDAFDGNTYAIWTWTDPFGANSFTRLGAVDLAAATGVLAEFPIDQPQFGSARDIQANDWRVQDAEYRNGRIWTAHTMSCNVGAGPTNCVRWAEIDPAATPTVVQAGVVSLFGQSLSFGNIAVNERGDAVLGFTATGPTRLPAVWVTGRLASDPPGFMRDAVRLKDGEIPYLSFDGSPARWGDYSEATTDPDGVTFWYIGEFAKDTPNDFADWGTQVAKLAFAGPDTLLLSGFEPGETGLPPPPPPPPAGSAFRVEMLVNREDADSAPGATLFEGDDVVYRYIAYNDGTTNLSNIVLGDSLGNTVTCPRGALGPGEDMLCSDLPGGTAVGNGSFSRTLTGRARVAGTAVQLTDTDAVVFTSVAPPGRTCVASGGTNCPAAIPDGIDGGGFGLALSSTISVTDCPSVTDVNVGFIALHTWLGDLRVRLAGPTGASIILLNQPLDGLGGCSRDNANAVFDDEGSGAANAQCATGSFALSGNRTPVQPLAAFDGLSGNGTWTLTVEDGFGFDTGSLRNWSLELACGN